VLPYRLDGCNSAARNFHNKDRVRTVLPCRPDGCSCLSIYVSVKENLILLELLCVSGRVAMASGRMYVGALRIF
jgi:hypothetical protein